MRRKSVTAVLIFIILLAFVGSAFSGGGPAPRKYGPIVVLGDPWGEYKRTTYTPPCYRPGPTAGSQGFSPAPAVTNFVAEFYFRYVVKQETAGQTFIQSHGRSE